VVPTSRPSIVTVARGGVGGDDQRAAAGARRQAHGLGLAILDGDHPRGPPGRELADDLVATPRQLDGQRRGADAATVDDDRGAGWGLDLDRRRVIAQRQELGRDRPRDRRRRARRRGSAA
jgi:hypothetical protein